MLHQTSGTVVGLIKMVDAHWIYGTEYGTDDLSLNCKVGSASGLVADDNEGVKGDLKGGGSVNENERRTEA